MSVASCCRGCFYSDDTVIETNILSAHLTVTTKRHVAEYRVEYFDMRESKQNTSVDKTVRPRAGQRISNFFHTLELFFLSPKHPDRLFGLPTVPFH